APADPWTGEELAPLLRMLLVDKLGYQARSANLKSAAAYPAGLAEEFARWLAVDLLAVYHHPDLGLLAANPKDAAQLAEFGTLQKGELLVIYAGKAGKEQEALCRKAAETALELFAGRKTKIPPELYRGAFTAKKAKNSPQKTGAGGKASGAALGKKSAPVIAPVVPERERVFRATPHYSVVVKNELFHNGNVEAWKRIIDSYNAKYPELRVSIYYEGERIQDINALFKWGKVKHGRSIQFSVAGNHIQDVAKLQRYLIQGASPQFEAFLRGPVGSILKLF
ncbi:MAG: hypothetical protein LBL19_05000, partial [Spirochaetaceae bacterium]|nr:hypothetical protein [Spirochaetaceae bacterium]